MVAVRKGLASGQLGDASLNTLYEVPALARCTASKITFTNITSDDVTCSVYWNDGTDRLYQSKICPGGVGKVTEFDLPPHTLEGGWSIKAQAGVGGALNYLISGTEDTQ